MKDVFISYKAEEIAEASWVKSVLENNGISCWMAPSCIPGGSSYAVEIPHAIKNAKVFVLILSSKAQSSRWVSREIDLALNEGKIVLPFMLENCALQDDFNFYLTNVQRYSAYENKVAAMEKMIGEIKAILGRSNTPPTEKAENTTKETTGSSPVMPETACEKNEKTVKTEKPKKSKKDVDLTGKRDTSDIFSFIFGIASVVLYLGMFLLPNILAIVLSFRSLNNISKGALGGKKLALWGFILGAAANVTGLFLLLSVIGLLVAIPADALLIWLFVKKYKAV